MCQAQIALVGNGLEPRVGFEVLMKETDQWRGPVEEARTKR